MVQPSKPTWDTLQVWALPPEGIQLSLWDVKEVIS